MRGFLVTLATLVCLSPGAFAQSGGPRPPDWAETHCTTATIALQTLPEGARLVCADVAALDQTLVYNRFGSFNPFGMIFALTRDLDLIGSPRQFASAGRDPACEDQTGIGITGILPRAGQVRLRDCKRPRPLVLRANVGDLLLVRVTNLLIPAAPDFSREMCQRQRNGNPPRTADIGRESVRPDLSAGTERRRDHGEVICDDLSNPIGSTSTPAAQPDSPDWPATRSVNFVVEGLEPLPLDDKGIDPACLGTGAVAPDRSFLCLYRVGQEGTHFLASRAAPAGGEGDGGSITHGLFGAVIAERPGTRWYRSQVSRAAMDAVWSPGGKIRHARLGGLDYEATQSGIPVLNMARVLDRPSQDEFASARRVEIVHSDLNAIIYCDAGMAAASGRPWLPGGETPAGAETVPADQNPVQPPLGCAVPTAEALANPASGDDAPYAPTDEPDLLSFREFTVFFHDELKTFYIRNFQELAQFGQLAGVRDGFAINYGASGMGTMLLANRKGIGPAASCAECLYEEFFLTSWANGDPALLEWYDDDPSNVHHSYLNDPVVFRNFHAGPKETHVFHLHAHQWFSGNDPSRGGYLDSQTVGPGQGFTYNIYHGGRPDGTPGTWSGGGAGNRNRTVGDSIFHCHLYPHFAQGMWALWRVHDVFEDGTRMLPDGEARPGLSTRIRSVEDMAKARTGSVDPQEGRWLDSDDSATADRIEGAGTPVPALVPLPAEPLPPLPSYPNSVIEDEEAKAHPSGPLRRHALVQAGLQRQRETGSERLVRTQGAVPQGAILPAQAPVPDDPSPSGHMPGYPFYIAGQAGHRPPQAPEDIARDLTSKQMLSGGLGRHVVTGANRDLGIRLPARIGNANRPLPDSATPAQWRRLERLRAQIVAKAVAMGDMTAHLKKARITTLPPKGTPLERSAMAFHHDGAGLTLYDATGTKMPMAQAGRYATGIAAAPGGGASPTAPGFQVNGAPPAPGAPFADPCGVPATDGTAITDPLKIIADQSAFARDPDLIGFRRYEGSAVQLDLVVNKAGWHDPQARINVLTEGSDDYKTGNGPISPRVSDREEPFFFRALSGECIEFRHTNELPKHLELDDFQVRTPTDTIGQHIHLVKFDVTSSDGSGNGWNYEDGTFAPDELMARRCAAHHGGRLTGFGGQADLTAWGTRAATSAECAALNKGGIWRLPLSGNRDLFQTTVQRWFADPITSSFGRSGDRQMATDRTMRTVFSHDHFGPSSIQQHGFYTALLIEPAARVRKVGRSAGQEVQVCETHPEPGNNQTTRKCVALQPDLAGVAKGGKELVGASKILVMGARNDPLHPDYREFALAVADFALLYDPRDRSAPPDFTGIPPESHAESHAGIARLACEARHAGYPILMESRCGSDLAPDFEGRWAARHDVPPAWIVGGLARDHIQHREDFHGNLFMGRDNAYKGDAETLRDHLIDYRRKAAFRLAGTPGDRTLARPVAPPQRPESISVDHHDPYLVNYRMAAVSLRIGTDGSSGSDRDCAPYAMARPGEPSETTSEVVAKLVGGTLGRCRFDRQDRDSGLAFSSRRGGPEGVFDPDLDPETPILEAYQGERLMVRLIQGAQEVQHVFNIAGMPFRRNVDQHFAQGMRPLATTDDPARSACFNRLRQTRPTQYTAWLQGRLHPSQAAWWAGFEDAIARCDNIEGATFAQEMGISEHFEMRARLRQDVTTTELSETPDPEGREESQPPGAPVAGHKDISDYLYGFGTLDAVWNGAWGLVRIYKDDRTRAAEHGESNDPVPASERIGQRLISLETVVKALHPGSFRTGGRPEASGAITSRTALPTCPAPLPGRSVRSSHGVIVALRAADLTGNTGKGTDYVLSQDDADGLMLALLTPGQLGADPAGNPPDTWSELDRETVLNAVRTVYKARPEPFVMRVNAGDCVVLRFVNTLPRDGMTDRLGDARMPPIVPLNTDPVPEVTDDGDSVKGILRAEMTPAEGIRPSALLGLSIGLPGGDQILKLPLGFGLNGQAIPAADTKAWASPEFAFYAGRTVVRDAVVEAVQSCTSQRTEDLGVAMPVCGRSLLDQDLGQRLSSALEGVEGARPASDRMASLRNLSLQGGRPRHLDPTLTFAGQATSLVLVLGPGQEVFVTPDGRLAADVADPAGQREHALADALCDGNQAACRQALDQAAARLSQDFQAVLTILGDAQVRFIPYAFGPVPVRATADPISQVPHGLFGVIDVVPAHWPVDSEPTDRRTWTRDTPPDRLASLAERVADRLEQAGGPPDRRLPGQAGPGTDQQGLTEDRAIPAALGFGQPRRYGGMDMSPDGSARDGPIDIREFVLFYQDGLNLHDENSAISWTLIDRNGTARSLDRLRPVPDCTVCDDSYDQGEQAVSYRSPGYVPLLRAMGVTANGRHLERGGDHHGDLNAVRFPADFFGLAHAAAQDDGQFPLTMHACHGEQVVIRVVHPGGRARQRAFVMNGLGYDDLFPGFGFPNSALVAPGKSVSAWLMPRQLADRSRKISFLWIDGPTTTAGGGTWGLVTLHPSKATLPGGNDTEKEVCP